LTENTSLSTTATTHQTTNLPASSQSPTTLASVSANIPNRNRLRKTRRSTGPVAQEDVQLALETDQEGQMTTDDESNTVVGSRSVNPSGGGDQKKSSAITVVGNNQEQQTSLSGHRVNRFSKTDSASSPARTPASGNTADQDYKKLYEREKAENERLLEKIKYLESLIESTRLIGSKQHNQTGSGDPGQPLADRERRTLEKRIAQLEEDTKVVEQLRADNQRLKEENGALIRVISKLSK